MLDESNEVSFDTESGVHVKRGRTYPPAHAKGLLVPVANSRLSARCGGGARHNEYKYCPGAAKAGRRARRADKARAPVPALIFPFGRSWTGSRV